ncbi:hypothetical protein DEU56DRAFT_899640 [Suillus clintonianus]|uniref:uncharacterized protein n=1 Tax=Suillus clintonianus TaxID=1904413 RepID=UPI001B87C761|nr:uncharacterized protein DEU56DRAFT_899640 [Suillus clintonianus]KAG2146802.1 hypothetical protein DEU56DRAFT_899640 [Suillus clintonianus]
MSRPEPLYERMFTRTDWSKTLLQSEFSNHPCRPTRVRGLALEYPLRETCGQSYQFIPHKLTPTIRGTEARQTSLDAERQGMFGSVVLIADDHATAHQPGSLKKAAAQHTQHPAPVAKSFKQKPLASSLPGRINSFPYRSTGATDGTTSHFFSSSGFPYPGSFAKITPIDALLRFLGLVNCQTLYAIVGVDNFHKHWIAIAYVRCFAAVTCPH